MKLSIAALIVGAGLSACAGKGATDTAKKDDFSRDLQLASSTSLDLATPKVNPALLTSLETKPQGAPQAASTVKKGAGNRAIRSHNPTVRATPELDVAAVDENSDQVTQIAEAPVATTNEPVAVAPRPSPTPVIVQAGDGSGDYGTSGNGGGIFGPGGGLGGVVIRGGGVDGDHCELHGTGRGGTMRRPVYIPGPISSGGMGGGIGIGSRTRGSMSGGGISRAGGSSSGGIGSRRR
jgi:hypothetical protein